MSVSSTYRSATTVPGGPLWSSALAPQSHQCARKATARTPLVTKRDTPSTDKFLVKEDFKASAQPLLGRGYCTRS